MEAHGERRALTLKKSEIVRGKQSFRLIFERGRRIEGKFLRCYVLPADRAPGVQKSQVQFGVATSRLLRRAVDRNRIKRLVRESYRRRKAMVRSPETAGGTVVFLFTAAAARNPRLPSYNDIEKDMIQLLAAAGRMLCE